MELSKKQSTILRAKQTIGRHITPFFGKYYITEIDVKTIQKWQKELLQKTTKNSKNSELLRNKYLENIQTLLRGVFNFARSFGYVSLNPMEMTPISFRRTYEEKKKMTILTKDQLRF